MDVIFIIRFNDMDATAVEVAEYFHSVTHLLNLSLKERG
ncbi:hypothetical protein D042_3555 [Vibrio parahaemolyticus NIHCB0757]|nr:hypothetical protein D042_3555 [Vibrio parahaemolyticus NIHCB0757]